MDELRPDHILQVGLGFWASKTLLSAVEMEVFTELAKHPQDLETLRGHPVQLLSKKILDLLDRLDLRTNAALEADFRALCKCLTLGTFRSATSNCDKWPDECSGPYLLDP